MLPTKQAANTTMIPVVTLIPVEPWNKCWLSNNHVISENAEAKGTARALTFEAN